jgi:hypothetical protein
MTIKGRLITAQKAGSLSVTDMATWFQCSRQTMHNWLAEDVEPSESRIAPIVTLLEHLERVIEDETKLPVPLHVTQFERKSYIESIRDDFTPRVPTARAAGGRKKMLGSNKKK